MLKIKKTDEKTELKKEYSVFIAIWLFILISIYLAVAIITAISQKGFLSPVDIFVIVLTAIGFVSICIYFYIDSTVRLIIDDKGITKNTIIESRFIPWSEVKDFGVSYCYRSRNIRVYCLYFSKKELPVKKNYAKKIKGDAIKFIVDGTEDRKLLLDVLPFCKEQIKLSPFVGKE